MDLHPRLEDDTNYKIQLSSIKLMLGVLKKYIFNLLLVVNYLYEMKYFDYMHKIHKYIKKYI